MVQGIAAIIVLLVGTVSRHDAASGSTVETYGEPEESKADTGRVPALSKDQTLKPHLRLIHTS